MGKGEGIPFGKYTLHRLIGRGGMAEVFLATVQDPEGSRRTVAVKRMLPHLVDVPLFEEMFLEEARLAARLNHVNIARLDEFGSVDGTLFIAMELVEGVDLSAVILEGIAGPIPLEQAVWIVTNICAALDFAHSLEDPEGQPLNIVHRDISPQNIMVAFDGAVRVLDFGIAKASDHAKRTATGMVRGKFAYISPEQIHKVKLDGRSDLFCAGILLYELCTGKYLIPRCTPLEMLQAICRAEIPAPTREGEPLAPALEAIIRKALARDRDQRYATAAQMRAELERYLQSTGQAVSKTAVGEYFTRRFAKKRRAAQEKVPGTRAVIARPAATEVMKEPPCELGLVSGEVSVDEEPTVAMVPDPQPTALLESVHDEVPTISMELDMEEPTVAMATAEDEVLSIPVDEVFRQFESYATERMDPHQMALAHAGDDGPTVRQPDQALTFEDRPTIPFEEVAARAEPIPVWLWVLFGLGAVLAAVSVVGVVTMLW